MECGEIHVLEHWSTLQNHGYGAVMMVSNSIRSLFRSRLIRRLTAFSSKWNDSFAFVRSRLPYFLIASVVRYTYSTCTLILSKGFLEWRMLHDVCQRGSSCADSIWHAKSLYSRLFASGQRHITLLDTYTVKIFGATEYIAIYSYEVLKETLWQDYGDTCNPFDVFTLRAPQDP